MANYREALRNSTRRIYSVMSFQENVLTPHTQYRVNLLRVIIIGNLLGTAIFTLYGLLGPMSNKLAVLILNFPVVSIHLWAWHLVDRGNLNAASRLIVGIEWLSFALIAIGSNGLYSSAMMGLMAILVTGTLLLDSYFARVLYVATVAYFFFLLFIEVTGNLPPAPLKDLPLRIIVLSSVATTLFLIISYHLFAIRRSEKQIAQMQVGTERVQMQREMTQNLAHDLRTPISVLMTTSYLIRKRYEKGMSIEEDLQKLERYSHNLSRLIDDLFELTLLDNTHPERDAFEVNIWQLLRESVEDSKVFASMRNIAVSIEGDAPAGALYALGDAKLLRQAFDNLIENAVHYGCENGYVRIRVKEGSSHVQISFEDNGIGIAPEHHARIFERFYRVDGARPSGDNRGTGIGLNAVKRIIELHQGSISLKSELGKGSIFTMEIPLIKKRNKVGHAV